jgi:hypothetical protein
MAYTAITPLEFRSKKGTISQKLGTEFALIDAQLDIVGQPQAQTVGPLLITGTTAWYVRMPCACTIDTITPVVGTAVDASTVITASVVAESAAMTGGAVTVGATVDASVAGYSVTATPTALNTVAADASITVAADGSASSGEAYFTIVYTPTA